MAAQAVKRVSLELGGKSANIILDDADFNKAVASGVGGYFNPGQTCSALTRMLVTKSRADEAVAIAKTAEGFTVGDPREGKFKLGPLVSATQRDRVVNYIKGIDEGAVLVWRARNARGRQQRLFRSPDGLRQCQQPHDDRSGRDLRTRPLDHSLRR